MQIRKLNIRGETTLVTQVVNLLLGALAFAVLFFLLYVLLSPYFDKNKETAKSYLKSFETAIDEADSSGSSEFSFWQGKAKMLYFGDTHRYILHASSGDIIFFRSKIGDNYMAFCYEKGGSKSKNWDCEYGISLKYPVEFTQKRAPIFGEGWKFKITRDDNSEKYYFQAVRTYESFDKAPVKKNLKILGEQRDILIFKDSSGKTSYCTISGITGSQVGGYSELAGDYKFDYGYNVLDKDGNYVQNGKIFKLGVGDSLGVDYDYFVPVDDYINEPPNIEILREIRKALDEKRENGLKLKVNYKDSFGKKDIDTTMKFTSKGLVSDVHGIGELRYNGEKLFRTNLFQQYLDDDLLKGFKDSLSLPDNQIVFGEERFDLGIVPEDSSSVGGSMEKEILYIKDNSIDKEDLNYLQSPSKLFGIDSDGNLYWISKEAFDESSGNTNAGYSSWEEFRKGEKEGMYIYLDDSEAKDKSLAISRLKNQLKNACEL